MKSVYISVPDRLGIYHLTIYDAIYDRYERYGPPILEITITKDQFIQMGYVFYVQNNGHFNRYNIDDISYEALKLWLENCNYGLDLRNFFKKLTIDPQ